MPSHYVAKLIRCVYGTRDAGAIWEDCYRDALELIGFKSGTASPCCFYHPERQLKCVVHGDDFTTLGADDDLDWLQTELAKHFELKITGRIGEGVDGDNEMRILNRIVAVTKDGVTYEADPRHVDLMNHSLGITNANAVASPGVKDVEPDYTFPKTNEPSLYPTLNHNAMQEAITTPEDVEPIDSFISKVAALSSSSGTRNLRSCLKQSKSTNGAKCLKIVGPLHNMTTFHDISPYSEIYGAHPNTIISTKGISVSQPTSRPIHGQARRGS